MHKLMEIGSEFWDIDQKRNTNGKSYENVRFLLSGRTAIDYIIKDIVSSRRFNSILLPSYCCHTMIEPFLSNGIHVEFFDVSFKNGSFHFDNLESDDFDAVMIMQYFGFSDNKVPNLIKQYKSKGKIVIEDATHSWFSKNPYSTISDYVFVSFRKWTGISAGSLLIKQVGDFNIDPLSETNEDYIRLREKAFRLKRAYKEHQMNKKSEFLSLFSQAEELLADDYSLYGVPYALQEKFLNLDVVKISITRRRNADALIKALIKQQNISVPELKKGDVPLFVPAFVDTRIRDKLHKYLMSKKIFTPKHWPLSHEHIGFESDIYHSEISLVCDQRYGIEQMNYITDSIIEYLEFKQQEYE